MNHLIKSTTLLTISNILTRVIALVFMVILARVLSVSDYGLFRYLLTLSMMYAIGFSWINTTLAKFVSEKKNFGSIVSDGLFSGIIIFAILSIIILIFEKNPLFIILFLLAVFVDDFYLGFVRGILNYVKLSGYRVVENIIQLVFLLISYIIFRNISLTAAIVFYSIAGILSLLIFESYRREIKISKSVSKNNIFKIYKYALPVTLGSIGWSLMFGINAIFINKFYGTEYVAYFSIGETIAQIFTFFPTAIATILLPKVSALKDKTKIRKPLTLALWGTTIISILMLIPLAFYKEWLINIVFSEKYIYAAVVILPLAMGQIMISLLGIYSSIFQGLNKPGIPSIIIGITAIINIIFSYFLIKNYGIIGAGLSNAITCTLALIISMIVFEIKWKKYSRM